MKRYAKLIQQSEKTFKGQSGLSVSHFHKLVQAIRLLSDREFLSGDWAAYLKSKVYSD